jgi:hypothetical protein
VPLRILYSSASELFEKEHLDRADRVYLDRHCHGLLEWCALHPRRKDLEGLCWLKPRISYYDHVFLGAKAKNLVHYKQIKKILGDEELHLYLLKNFSSEKDLSDAKGVFDQVEWVENLNEEKSFVRI